MNHNLIAPELKIIVSASKKKELHYAQLRGQSFQSKQTLMPNTHILWIFQTPLILIEVKLSKILRIHFWKKTQQGALMIIVKSIMILCCKT